MSNTTAASPIGRIMLKNVRLAFAQGLFTASVMPGADAAAKPKFNCGLILEPDHPQLAEIRDKMKAVAKEKWKDKWQAQYTALEKADKLALHDGDLKPNYDGYPGNFYLSPSAQESAPPTLLDGSKRINAQLRGVQFFKDGDAFAAGRPADSDEFEAVSEGAEAEDFA